MRDGLTPGGVFHVTTRDRRASWYQVRLSILVLAFFGVCLGQGCWWQCPSAGELTYETDRLRIMAVQYRVKELLRGHATDQEKLASLAAYVKVGDRWDNVRARLGPPSGVGTHGPGFVEHDYDTGLVVGTYPDGEVYGIAYYAPVDANTRTLQWLSMDHPVTWPKSVRSCGQSSQPAD